MKQLLKILLILITSVLIFIFTLNWFNPIWWQDVKLITVPYWGVTTVTNNPLLPSVDKDLTDTKHKEEEIKPRISTDKLLSGGVAKDGIPSIDNPQFESITETAFADDELIIGVEINGDARAYPYAILNWHELVNDTVGGIPLAVSYCPLCETNSVFVREIDGQEVEFGVSGKLYESCLVMYDRLSHSLYSQPWGMGIMGSETNRVLERVDAIRTTVAQWRAKYPDAQILTTDTGYSRNYSAYPYGSYYSNEQIIFPANNQTARTERAKEITQIVFSHTLSGPVPINTFSGEYTALTQQEVRRQGSIDFTWQGHPATASWNDELSTIIFTKHNGEVIPNMALFNFVYYAHFE